VAAKRLMFFCESQTLDPQDLAQFLDALSKSAAIYMPRLSLIEGIVLDYDTISLARAYLRPTTGCTIPFASTLSNRNGSLYGHPIQNICST
jgi:hypothetical protein